MNTTKNRVPDLSGRYVEHFDLATGEHVHCLGQAPGDDTLWHYTMQVIDGRTAPFVWSTVRRTNLVGMLRCPTLPDVVAALTKVPA